MPSRRSNKVILAAAGSRKTTHLVDRALADGAGRSLITTYTNENLEQIRTRIIRLKGYIPEHITVKSLFAFLLQDCARPYQNSLSRKRARSVNFSTTPSRYVRRTDTDRFYFDSRNNIYERRLSDFAVTCNEKTGGLVIDRLERIYDSLYFDEVQDLNGYDLELLDLLFKSRMGVCAVGDPRQWTYSTNRSSKNKKYKGAKIGTWFTERRANGLCDIEERNECYRCNQKICDFADALYSDLMKTVSRATEHVDHAGVFVIGTAAVRQYYQRYAPIVLRHNKNADTFGCTAINFGTSKGQSYDRVLIVPTEKIRQYLNDGDPTKLEDMSKARLYVAVTRARHSVVFVHDSDKECIVPRYRP